jgi:hypothetical protein
LVNYHKFGNKIETAKGWKRFEKFWNMKKK